MVERLNTTEIKDPKTGLYLRPQGVYIAGRVAHGLEPVRQLYTQIEKLGHYITYRWADIEDVKKPYRDFDNRQHNDPLQQKMLQGASQAEVFILVSDQHNIDNQGLHGALMEWGAFLADCARDSDGRRGYIVGPNSRQSIFDSPDYILFPENIEEVLVELDFLSDQNCYT